MRLRISVTLGVVRMKVRNPVQCLPNGLSPLTCLAWVTLPGAFAPASLTLRIVKIRKAPPPQQGGSPREDYYYYYYYYYCFPQNSDRSYVVKINMQERVVTNDQGSCSSYSLLHL